MHTAFEELSTQMSAVAHQNMENIHGVDVSWIHSSANKDSAKAAKVEHSTTPNGTQPVNGAKPAATNGSAAAFSSKPADAAQTQPKQIPQRPGISRNGSNERTPTGSLPKSSSPGTSRRNSWLSSISSKFSSSPSSAAAATMAAAGGTVLGSTPEEREPRPAAPSAPKNAILPHGQSPEGNAPYTPVPTRGGHPNFLTSALRRLSSSGGQLSGSPKHGNGGICPRIVLNVDKGRERCQLPELDLNKLRRVAFCVDVEIASSPRYSDEPEGNAVAVESKDKNTKKKLAEKGEAAALKKPDEVVEQKEKDGVIQASGEHLPKEPEKESSDPIANGQPQAEPLPNGTNGTGEQTTTKKKEKKKRSEEERKARKEKKRKLAEENGQIPVEMVRSDSDCSTAGTGTPRSTSMPTTDPVRIYRRCCQLRESPILKKITEQLASPANLDKPGFVSRLDLTDCWLQLPDLVTLGDYLAVVPVKELVMENCGLTDEGVRVILAGLLAAATPDQIRRKNRRKKDDDVPAARGAVQRVVFKNNPKIGRDGWRHISLFINMSRSLKCLDVSMIPFPQPVSSPDSQGNQKRPNAATDPAVILSKALATRLAGPELELLNIAASGLTATQIGLVIDGIIASGLKRLGLAENNIDAEGMAHVARWLKTGVSEGLDLGCQSLEDHLETIADALNSCESNPLFALSIANCDLTAESLWTLFPTLAKLKNFRFIDLSMNHKLFTQKPNAVYMLRKFIPKMPNLKRIHLTDCSMTSEQAIALAEIFPDSTLAHVNLLDNPELSALADATDDKGQEEACALYASLMAAVRVSKTLICIDIDVPSPQSSEVVKALAKQVIAYSLRNMERGPITEIAAAVPGLEVELPEEKDVELPEVLTHLVGREDGGTAPDDDDDAAPDEDYVIGGTGVVKALGICLKNRTTDSRRPSIDRAQSGTVETDSNRQRDGAVGRAGKAKDMSKNLLGSARKIRARLQPALLKESRTGDRNNYRKLLFLDETLERMIQRFEDEYPETRLATTDPIAHSALHCEQPSHVPHSATGVEEPTPYYDYDEAFHHDHFASADEDDEGLVSRPMLSRHNSDVSLASKAQTQEEGRMHRFGMKFRRDIIDAASPPLDSSAIASDSSPPADGSAHTVPHNTKWAPHLEVLRAMLEEMGGEEIKKKIEETGQDELLKELGEEAGTLRQQLIEVDPEGWARFTMAQEVAMSNMRRIEGDRETQRAREDEGTEPFPTLEG